MGIKNREMTQRESSRKDWVSQETNEDINSGSLQRIADATELMAKNYAQIIRDRDNYNRWWKEQRAENERLVNRIRGLKGAITRLKNPKQ